MGTIVAPEKATEKRLATVFISNGYSVEDIVYDRNNPGEVAEVEGKVASLMAKPGMKMVTEAGPVETFDPEAQETTILTPFAAG